MMSKNDPDTQADVQPIEKLTERYRELNDMQIRAQTNLENAQANLDSLEKEALEKFQTADVNELKSQLEKMESENQRLQAEYQKHLDQIESDLASVEKQFSEDAS